MKTKEERIKIAREIAVIMLNNDLTYAEGFEILMNVFKALAKTAIQEE